MNKKQKVFTGKTSKDGSQQASSSTSSRQIKKSSEYGKQLREKQRVKHMYGMRERQFRKFFVLAKKSKTMTGPALLVALERRLDNVVFRLKLSSTRLQARQLIVHGHIEVNGEKVYSPSFLIKAYDVISVAQKSVNRNGLVNDVIKKQLASGIKVPDWLELDQSKYVGRVLRLPLRIDIQASIQENFIVELYSK